VANPQLENGYTSIANGIFEHLAKLRIPGEARQVLDFILRKTWGWHKKSDMISLNQFVEGTGLNKVHVCRAINTLLAMNLVTKKGNARFHVTQKGNASELSYGSQMNFNKSQALPKKVTSTSHITQKGKATAATYEFQKDFEKWKALPKKVKGAFHVTQKGNRTLPKKVPTKETITKEKKIWAGSKKPDPPNTAFFKIWDQKFQEHAGARYTFTGQKETQLVKKMIATDSLERLAELIDVFWRIEDDEFINRAGRTIGVFYSQINKLKTVEIDPYKEFRK